MKKNTADFNKIEGGVTASRGFSAAGVASGIKKDGSEDIALIFSKSPCSAAGVFTKNKVTGHSLELCRDNLCDGKARCVLINSGNANACIGPSGYGDARSMAAECSALLNIEPGEVLTGSTGVIGVPLPLNKVFEGIGKAVESLSPDGGSNAAKAIMTTDTFPKESALEVAGFPKTFRIGGMAKGSGMIHPDMATMIGVITSDADLSPALLKKALSYAVDRSFNRITVDGDTSVCDKVLLLVNGTSGFRITSEDSDEYNAFRDALCEISIFLSKAIASDGEGATKLIEINVVNAATKADALLAAKAIANSPLVKTAFYGEDANWGRILTAAGYSGANFKPENTSVSIGGLTLYEKGRALQFDEQEALAVLKRKNIRVFVDFNNGESCEKVWTCDLSHGYIDINAHYRT